MARTTLIKLLAILAPALAVAEQPNIVLFMADDMGMGDTSAYQDFTANADAVQVHTPSMERLAQMGIRFTDAHTPASRCTTTRYGLLTGRYAFRNRIKHYVLFGSQGDPMIEADRPTIATMLRDGGYRTAMFGKWHVGLRYRRSDGSPAAGWADADLRQPLYDAPLDHGFDVVRFTARSHMSSGPDVVAGSAAGPNTPEQDIGPGHIHGREVVGATEDRKRLISSGPDAYLLTKLGSRHSDHAMGFLQSHVNDGATRQKPFFLYLPANANHGPYTPDESIGGRPVAGASRTKLGAPMDARHDLIYENDVALGRLVDWLEATEDPRDPEQRLIANTLVIFTSDNGAEIDSNIATGPFRSNKGSCYEGGHRVPFIAAWPAGGIAPGSNNSAPIGLQDLFATFAEITGEELPDLGAGEKGAEDSISVLAALEGEELPQRPPLFFHDNKDALGDNAVVAMRLDNPSVSGRVFEGQWKIFFDERLLRAGEADAVELFNLAEDQWEKSNRLADPSLESLVEHLEALALLHRNAGGHRLAAIASPKRVTFDWGGEMAREFSAKSVAGVSVRRGGITMRVAGKTGESGTDGTFSPGEGGLGLAGGKSKQVDGDEAFVIRFDRDVIVESAALVAGSGTCGGSYRVGVKSRLAIYCVDGDNDSKDQQGILGDIGVLKRGEELELNASPHFGVEAPGEWRLGAITVRGLGTSS